MTSWLALALVLSAAPTGSGAGLAPCVGDCSGNGTVVVSEAIIGVNIALGHAALATCESFDRNGDDAVGIDELVGAVDSMLNGCTPVAGLHLEPVGGEFRVSQGTIGNRVDPQVALDATGGFVAIWGGTQTMSDNFGLAGRRFLSDGSPATPLDFDVNTFTTDAQRTQDVIVQPDGTFLAVWETSGIFIEDDDPRAGIYGHIFDAGGVSPRMDFKINTNDDADIREDQPVGAALADGTYMIAWTIRENTIGGPVAVTARRADVNGLPVGEEFAVTEYVGFQDHPAIAALPDGGFVVAWQDAYRDGSGLGVFGQRFDSAAGRVGGEFQVNISTVSVQHLPSVAAAPDGAFLVTWSDIGDVLARRFDSTGLPSGTEFVVNTARLGMQAYSSVAAEPEGGFLVVWMSGGSIGHFNIFGQRLNRGGAKVGGEFQVNTFTSTQSDRSFPEVASNAAGDVVVVWEAQTQDSSSPNDVSIRGQRYRLVE